jgi:hypothetical protein
MSKEFDFEIVAIKAKERIHINMTLLLVAFTIFTFVATIKPEILTQNKILAVQLTLSIPFLITSSFARTKEIKPKLYKLWNKMGFFNFIIGYSFLINTIGIMLALLVSTWVSIIFFITNILMSVIYSYIEFRYGGDSLSSRLLKDGSFILILILLGILPSLGML